MVIMPSVSKLRIINMPKFLIERTLPGAGALAQDQLQQIAQRSMCAIEHMGPSYRWLQSYIVGDTIYCVHEAASEEAVREHSRRGGFPIGRISQIDGVIEPSMAQSRPSMIAGG
jgi:hypothetical protein